MASLVNRIESKIKEKGLTFKQVERECGLGNGTIKRWAEQSPRLDKLVLVSEYLQVSLDFLVFGSSESETFENDESLKTLNDFKETEGLICDGIPLSSIEVDLVAMFRLLPPSHQEELFNLTYFKYKHHVEEKKESIYSTYSEEEKKFKKSDLKETDQSSGIA
ncbi:MAG: helix-turn-helix domain-containing protein [Hungatella sp.]|jgi:transcriptional regulator with XRE-family HTH domain|nr:helix-turn-helix domain-containing protein [Hungatella sp.]